MLINVLDAKNRRQHTKRSARFRGISQVIDRLCTGFLKCLCVTSVLGFVAACATAPPVQEMSDARQAIAAAKEAGAEQLAAGQLDEAEELLMKAEKYLGTGGSGNLRNAKQAAIDAKKIAFEALLASRSARDAVDSEPAQ